MTEERPKTPLTPEERKQIETILKAERSLISAFFLGCGGAHIALFFLHAERFREGDNELALHVAFAFCNFILVISGLLLFLFAVQKFRNPTGSLLTFLVQVLPLVLVGLSVVYHNAS